jgi:hypothetical protein
LVLHFFEIFEKQNGIERVVALLLQLVDNLALTDHALLAVCYERRDNSLSTTINVTRKLRLLRTWSSLAM